MIDYLILILYMAVAFVPHFRAFDVIYTQWYYIAILNLVSFAYILLNRNYYKLTFNNKLAKFVFLGSLAFLALTCLSMLKAISLSESIVFLSMLLLTLIAFFIIYTIVKDNPKKYFSFIAHVLLVSLLIEAFQVISHFGVKNGSQPRSAELFKGLNPTYGNRNILAASLIVKMSLAFYIFYKSDIKGKIFSLFIIFISVISILLIGARTAIYGLPIIITTLLIGFIMIEQESKIKTVKKVVIPVVIICSLAFLGSLSINKIHKGKLNSFNSLVFTKQKKDLYKEEQGSIALASDSGRKKFWYAAIDGFKENPIIGVGIGNWKMIDKPELLRSNKANSYFYPRRVHNDFLQVLSEMGVLGFLVFIGFFGIIYFLLIKNIFKKNNSEELKLINLTVLGAFMAYSLDSLINFPAERTPIQIMIFGILATVISFNPKGRVSIHKYIGYGLLGLMIVLVYLNHQVFISSKYQLILRNNINGKNLFKAKYKVSYDQMNRLIPDFPKLNGMGQPNDFGLATLAYSEGKYIQAMDHLHKAIEVGPYQQEHMGFKAMIFELNKTYKNEDSALYYAKKVFKNRPGVINQFNLLSAIYRRRKDTANLLKVYNEHLKTLPSNEKAWLRKSNFYLRYYKDLKRAQQVLDSALLFKPNSKVLNDAKKRLSKAKISGVSSVSNNVNLYASARKHFAEGKYGKAREELLQLVESEPNNNVYKLTLGQSEIYLKKYPEAIKNITTVISSGTFKDGKPEYNRGIAYLRSGQKKKAASDFRASKAKGFHLAKKLDKRLLE